MSDTSSAVVGHATALARRIATHTARLTIIGQGYVGLPLAIAFARAGFQVAGLDSDLDRVTALATGRSHVPDVPSEELQAQIRAGRYQATTETAVLADSDAIIICVPTPLGKSKDPDISYVIAASKDAAARFHPGKLIILESTTYPGTTEELLLPLFEAKGGTVGEDLFLAFSPERIDPGNPSFKVGDIPKVVGGTTETCRRLAAGLYREIVPRVHEFSVMCRYLGVDSHEVIDAAATKPFGFMPFYPGPGIGGHCIPVDPLYLSWKMRLNGYQARFISLADDINHSMPGHVLSLVGEALNDSGLAFKGARILVLGVAYKRGIGDTRESPAFEIIAALRRKGAEVSYADPHVPALWVDGAPIKAVDVSTDELEG